MMLAHERFRTPQRYAYIDGTIHSSYESFSILPHFQSVLGRLVPILGATFWWLVLANDQSLASTLQSHD